jgi:putative ABC transport system substrate-binding protein
MGQVRRRQFLISTGALRAAPLAISTGALRAAPLAQPQQTTKLTRIGYLSPEVAESEPGRRNQRLLRDSLRRVGYEVGRNLTIEWRFAEGKRHRLDELAQDLVRSHVELIVAFGNGPTLAAKRASGTIPVVMFIGVLPVELGIVESLARPGGNVTGTVWTSPELPGKILQILKEAAPDAVRVALLWNPSVPVNKIYELELQRAAQTLGMTYQNFDVTRAEEIPAVLGRIAASRSDALNVIYDPAVIGSRLRDIAAFAIQRKLVSIGSARAVVSTGGLFYYGPVASDIADQTASYVDRILRGAKPADLPVQMPSKYELVINAKTARAIGYKIPPALALRADELIE